MTDAEKKSILDTLVVVKHQGCSIFIRSKTSEGWGPVALSDLTPKEWAEAVLSFIERALPATEER